MNISLLNRDFRGNIISQIFYLWLDKLFFKGLWKKLSRKDLNSCPREHRSKELFEKFNKYWQIERHKNGSRKPDIKIALSKTIKTTFLFAGGLLLIDGLLMLVLALLVARFSSVCDGTLTNNHSSYSSNSLGESIAYAFSISLITVYMTINHITAYFLLNTVGMQIRTICITALYKKVLLIQQSVLHKITIGHIINLVSNDVYKFDIGILWWSHFWIAPIVLILSIIIIVVYIGPIGLIGVAYIILHIPVQTLLGISFGHFRYLQSTTADKRIRLMDQIIRGMRVIKFYVWEVPFVRYIGTIRRREVLYAVLSGFSQSTIFAFFSTSLFISLFLVYSSSVLLNRPIQLSNLGLTFLVYNIIRFNIVLLIGHATFSARECVIALARIQRVLELPENIDNCVSHSICSPSECPSIRLHNFSASWKGTDDSCRDNLVLKSINLSLSGPRLVAIAGPVGAGKSSLLLSLNNELPGICGELSITGASSYTAQEPWIFSGTIRDNILFSSPLDTLRYEEVVTGCGLMEDITSLEKADMTLIGERGVTLSGGQKARVALARAVYQQRDVYLLDDPLSAVDVKVGGEIFEKCIRTILRGKLVLLVTHHTHFARQAEHVVVMREGEVECSGSYQEVLRNRFCREFLQGLEEEEDGRNRLNADKIEQHFSGNSMFSPDKTGHVQIGLQDVEKEDSAQPLSTSLTGEEYQSNSNSILIYFRYFLAGGVFATVLMLFLTALSNGGLLLAYWWIQSISKCSLQPHNESVTYVPCPWYFDITHTGSLGLLALFTFSGSIFVFLRGFNFYYIALQASRRLHNRMLARLAHTPMYFFDTNPSGRILNRFSKDIGFLDEQLPLVFYDFWQFATYNLAIAIASCAVQIFLLLPFSILAVSTLLLRYYYLKSSTQLKQLESVARSPLYSHISLTLQGLSTIRALSMEERLLQDFHYFQDEHSCTWFHYVACNKWFGQKLDCLAAFIVIFGVFSASIARCVYNRDELIGFSIPLLLSLPLFFQYTVRLSGEVEILMVSVERVLKYCELPQEIARSEYSDKEISSAQIEFSNVFFRYSKDVPCSLSGVSLKVRPGEKIGIIGRTGAGKSSLFNSLFLLSELMSGSISIGGKDISNVSLYEHRRRLSIIPQDPFLFSGTLRYNLDPFHEFSTDEIWRALDKSHLIPMVESLPDQLLAPVEEDGLNFSTGERQLLCLARALLRNNQIILIDEATANVDRHTDSLVQQAIRSHFSSCSVLTIAHRLETVLDADRILVLERGRVVEDDTPLSMLRHEGSYLNELLRQVDANTRAQLRESIEANRAL